LNRGHRHLSTTFCGLPPLAHQICGPQGEQLPLSKDYVYLYRCILHGTALTPKSRVIGHLENLTPLELRKITG
jgi:hypothetical protein